MKPIILECEVVTPVFLSGANTHAAELRGPSFKGLIRYWWRATNANLDVNTLRDREQKIFGGTGSNENESTSNRSKVVLHIINSSKSNNTNTRLKDEIVDLDPNSEKHQGISYLLYSVASGMNSRPYIKPETKFLIKIYAPDDVMDELMKALAAFNCFGNIGSRSRRGAGSINIKIKDDCSNEALIPYKNFFDLSDVTNREELKNRFEQYGKMLSIPVQCNYSILKGSHVYIFDKCNNWIDALENIGEKFRSFRTQNKGRVFETPYFGIPVMHSDKSLFIAKEERSKKRSSDEKSIKRRPSPLIFKILKTSDKLYFPMIINMNGDFLPQNYVITNKRTDEQKKYSNEIVGEFLNTISNVSLEAEL